MAWLEQHIHEEPKTFISKYVFSFDHKVIAKQFLWYGIFFLGVGGMMALLIRWTLAYPGEAFPIIGHMMFPESVQDLSIAIFFQLFNLSNLLVNQFAVVADIIFE